MLKECKSEGRAIPSSKTKGGAEMTQVRSIVSKYNPFLGKMHSSLYLMLTVDVIP